MMIAKNIISLQTLLSIVEFYPTEDAMHGHMTISAREPIEQYAERLGVKIIDDDYDGELSEEPTALIGINPDSNGDDYLFTCADIDIFRTMISNFEKNRQVYPYNVFVWLTTPINLGIIRLHMLDFYAELGDVSSNVRAYLYSYPPSIGIEQYLVKMN